MLVPWAGDFPAGIRMPVPSMESAFRVVRSYDMVGRYGGEEFLVILSGCPGAEALHRADELRQAMEATPVTTAAARFR